MTDLAPVTQADRDAVQAFHRAMFDRLNQDLKSDTPTLGEDMGDAGTLVQAFARHRLASTQPAPAFPREEVSVKDIAGIIRDEVHPHGDTIWGAHYAAEKIAALLQGKQP